ncbi:MAG: mechanosensitive ion channel family protein [Flavobacteriales bacterium Tduv]
MDWRFKVDWVMVEHAVKAGIILSLAILANRFLKRAFTKFFQEKIDKTKFSFFKNSISFFVSFIALMLIFRTIPALKNIGDKFLAGSAILIGVIGFASQKIFSDLSSSVFILISQPFRVGDYIELSGGIAGYVQEITLRHTVIRTLQNKKIFVPNSKINEDAITNNDIGDRRTRRTIDIGIGYASDIDCAIRIIQEEIEKHPLSIDARTDEEKVLGVPRVVVKLTDLGDFAVNLKAFGWAEDNMKSVTLEWDVLKTIKERFDQEGIEIPFPYRTFVFKNQSSFPPVKGS